MSRFIHVSVLLLVAAACSSAREPPRLTSEVIAHPAAGELPRTDPLAAVWNDAPVTTLSLLRQDLVEPKLVEDGVGQLEVRVLHDATWIAFRLTWMDPSRDILVGPGRFSDAVAVQLPMEATGDVTDPAMGLKGRAVAISAWKAAWQETGDPVAALRPNMHVDLYPYEAARPGAREQLERQYAPARAVGNLAATHAAGNGLQDTIAEGAGTLTPAPEQVSVGKGVWSDGRWSVTIARPKQANGASPFRDGRRTYVAFAVWDGARGNVGARKMRSAWLPLTLEVKP